jgi:hypothetical protein
MQRPVIGRQQLTLRLETSVCRPELGGEEESSVCFGAARIDGVRVGGAGAGQYGIGVGCGYTVSAIANRGRIGREMLTQLTGVVDIALARVQDSQSRGREQRSCGDRVTHLDGSSIRVICVTNTIKCRHAHVFIYHDRHTFFC